MNSLNHTLRRIFKPGRYDGPFWVIWIFFLTPAIAAWSIYRGHLAEIAWWGPVAAFYFMMFGVTLGFHRYFSHRSFTTGRVFQFILGLIGTLSGQTGPISWAMGHEIHHKNCELQPDPHSTNVSFWHAQGFWLWTGKSRFDNLEDSHWFKYPELVFLEAVAPILYNLGGVVMFFAFGLSGAIWYWLVPTFLSFNATMMINSLGHGHGFFPYKDFYQPEHCRATNIPWAFPFILGDNWHNNHHAYPNAAYHGWKWWEIDPNRYALVALRALGVVSRTLVPSEKVLEKHAASRRTMPAKQKLTANDEYAPRTEPTPAQ